MMNRENDWRASVARALTPHLDLRQLFFATTLSWLAGLVAIGAPGGLGVREAVFVSLARGLSAQVATAVAVLARMAFITADAAGAALALLARRFRS